MIDASLIETHIVTTLKNVPELSNILIDIYMDDLGEDIRTIPAIYTLYNGIRAEKSVNTHAVRQYLKGEFNIFVIGKNLKGRKEASFDVRSLLIAIRQALNGLKYENTCLTFEEETPHSFKPGGVCIYLQRYSYNDIFSGEKK